MTREDAIEQLLGSIAEKKCILREWDDGGDVRLLYSKSRIGYEIEAMEVVIAALSEPVLDENGLARCGCGGKAQIWPSDPTQFTHVITDYEVGCTECAMTTGWVRGKQENAIKVWNTAMGWKGGAE